MNGALLLVKVDSKLRDSQAGFRQDRPCTDHNATLCIIIEQSMEAFDSVDRETLWKLLGHCGVLKIIPLIQYSYQRMSCRVVHGRQFQDLFEFKTGVRQGCLLTPFLFKSARIGFHVNNGEPKITRMQHASNSAVTVAGQKKSALLTVYEAWLTHRKGQTQMRGQE